VISSPDLAVGRANEEKACKTGEKDKTKKKAYNEMPNL